MLVSPPGSREAACAERRTRDEQRSESAPAARSGRVTVSRPPMGCARDVPRTLDEPPGPVNLDPGALRESRPCPASSTRPPTSCALPSGSPRGAALARGALRAPRRPARLRRRLASVRDDVPRRRDRLAPGLRRPRRGAAGQGRGPGARGTRPRRGGRPAAPTSSPSRGASDWSAPSAPSSRRPRWRFSSGRSRPRSPRRASSTSSATAATWSARSSRSRGCGANRRRPTTRESRTARTRDSGSSPSDAPSSRRRATPAAPRGSGGATSPPLGAPGRRVEIRYEDMAAEPGRRRPSSRAISMSRPSRSPTALARAHADLGRPLSRRT